MTTYYRSNLEGLTVRELREMCVENNIVGMSKKPKEVLIQTLINLTEPINELNFNINSERDYEGDDFESTVKIFAGASSGNYHVAGKTISSVIEILRDILNIPAITEVLVNGKEASNTYVVKAGDSIEFIKPAGEKGKY